MAAGPGRVDCTGGSESEPGVFNDNGALRRGATGATGTIYFRCGNAPSVPASRQTRYEELAALKALLDSGALTKEEFDAEKAKLLGN
ncbi:SHOCT domain-containing protein [Bacillus subtilis subsp. subtilis]|nr:SHOCT domain-containing protein [Bacillus subtilis subsp. subtilis]